MTKFLTCAIRSSFQQLMTSNIEKCVLMCQTAAGHQGEGKCRGRPDVLYSSCGFLFLNAVILVQNEINTRINFQNSEKHGSLFS